MSDGASTFLPPGWPKMSVAQAHAALTAPGAPFEMAEDTIRGQKLRVWKNAPPTLRDVFPVSYTHLTLPTTSIV